MFPISSEGTVVKAGGIVEGMAVEDKSGADILSGGCLDVLPCDSLTASHKF